MKLYNCNAKDFVCACFVNLSFTMSLNMWFSKGNFTISFLLSSGEKFNKDDKKEFIFFPFGE